MPQPAFWCPQQKTIISVPDGYRIVTGGNVKDDDKYYIPATGEFSEVSQENIGTSAGYYIKLIRPIMQSKVVIRNQVTIE